MHAFFRVIVPRLASGLAVTFFIGVSMNTDMHVNDWLPAYVLDILSEEETVQVAEHLSTCPACRTDLRTYQAAADELPLALVQTAPSIALKDRLMKSIHSRQMQAAEVSHPTLWQQLAGLMKRSAPAWGMALILVLALGNWALWQRLNQVSSQAANSMRVVALANTMNAPTALGSLVISKNGEYGTLVVENLAVLNATQQYQLWLVRDGQRVSGGVFSVNSDGYASLIINSPNPLDQYQTVGITVEPAGGSPGPTGAKVLGGSI